MSMSIEETVVSAPSQNPQGFQLLASLLSTVGGVASNTLSSIPARRYLWVQVYSAGYSGADQLDIQFNGDSGNNYAYRTDTDGAVLSAATAPQVRLHNSHVGSCFSNMFIHNEAAKPKRIIGSTNFGSSAVGTAPSFRSYWALWDNTLAQITSIKALLQGGQTISAGMRIEVYGSDGGN